MDQGNLFAAPDRPLSIVVSVTRDWLTSDTLHVVRTTVHGTKGHSPKWCDEKFIDGRHAALIVTEMTAAAVAAFGGSGWHTQPPGRSQEDWETHLTRW